MAKTQSQKLELYEEVGIEAGRFGRYYQNSDGEEFFCPLGNAFYIAEIFDNWDTGEYFILLETEYKGKTERALIPRKNLTKNEILGYSKHGFDFFDQNYTTVLKLIQKQEDEFDDEDITYQHAGLGWIERDGSWIFRGSEIRQKPFYSTYNGDFNIKPQGDFKVWLDMVKTYIIGNTALEFALVVGFTSVLVGRLGSLIDNEALFIHLCGASTTGKTTAAYLIASVAGSPNIQDDGLLRTWNSTTNAVMKTLVNNYGFPIIFDEFSMKKGSDNSNLIYMLTSGRDKSRMRKDRSLQKTEGFRTTVVSTGEVSILNKCNGNTGLEMRLLEVNNVTFTPDSKTAEKIKQVCSENYGEAINKFAEFIQRQKPESLKKGLEIFRQKFIASSKAKDRYTHRLSKKYAVILLTAHYVRKVFDLNINIKNLKEFLVDVEYRNTVDEPRDIAAKAYEELLQFVEMNKSHFCKSNSYVAQSSKEYWGKIDKSKADADIAYQIVIMSKKLTSIMKNDLGYEDTTVILKELVNMGLLEGDKDGRHLAKQRTISQGGGKHRCYVFNVLNDETTDESPEESGELTIETYENLD